MSLTLSQADQDLANERLFDAAMHGSPDEVVRAIAAGANIHLLNADGDNMLLCAAIFNRCEDTSALFIANGLSMFDYDRIGQTCLHAFASAGWGDLVERALDAGLEVDVRDDAGITPIQVAVKQSDPTVVAILLDRGASIAQQNQGASLLDLASAPICESLVSRGLEVDDADDNDETALHKAAWEGDAAKVMALIQVGANIEARSRSLEETPLFVAARLERGPCVAILLEAGAKTDSSPKESAAWSEHRQRPGNKPIIDSFNARQALRRGACLPACPIK